MSEVKYEKVQLESKLLLEQNKLKDSDGQKYELSNKLEQCQKKCSELQIEITTSIEQKTIVECGNNENLLKEQKRCDELIEQKEKLEDDLQKCRLKYNELKVNMKQLEVNQKKLEKENNDYKLIIDQSNR